MFKVFKAELKKIFLKPSIFVVTGLVILMLAISTFLYSPSTKTKYEINYNLEGNTVGEYYNSFVANNGAGYKTGIDAVLDDATLYVQHYATQSDTIAELKQVWTSVESFFDTTPNHDYISLYTQWQLETNETQKSKLATDLNSQRTKLLNAINNFEAKYIGYANSTTTTFLVTPELNNKILNVHLATIKNYFEWANDNEDVHGTIINNLQQYEAFKKIFDDLNQLLKFEPNEDVVDLMNVTKIEDGSAVTNESSPIVIARQRLDDIKVQIDNYNLENASKSDTASKEEMLKLINNYYLTAHNAYDIAIGSIKVSGLSKYSALDVTKYKNFENANIYEMKESLTRTKYLFDTNTYAYQYADPFSVVQSSNTEVNAFDYSYFALRLCVFFITIYIVVLASGTIAGEQSSGTLKLLAMRPYSRNKLLSAKIWSILSIGAILIGVSSLASLVIGGVTYGFNFTNVLMVFNASSAGVISPILLYIVAMLTMFAEVAFYAMLSVFISTVFKSNTGAISVSTLIFFVSLVLNVVATNVPAIGLIPFVNVNFYKYFGSSFLANVGTNNLIQMILTPTVFAGSTFWTSLVLYVLTFAIVTVVTHVIFNKRDIK